jgi:hypothetical protein
MHNKEVRIERSRRSEMRRGTHLWIAGLVLGLGLSVTKEASAQAPSRSPETDASMHELVRLALSAIHKVQCENRKPCAPATPDELANPPIPMPHANHMGAIALVTAMMSWCGSADKRRAFLHVMDHYERVLLLKERQLVLLALVHDIAANNLETQWRKEKGACPAATRKRLDTPMPPKMLDDLLPKS